MGKLCFEILTSLLLISTVAPATIPEETSRKSSDVNDTKIPLELYSQCLKMDTVACVGYKILSFVNSNEQNRTGRGTPNKSDTTTMEDKVDDVLLGKTLEYMVPDLNLSTPDAKLAARRTYQLNKKMLLPLLMGVVLKFGSMIPIVLSKLAFIGTMALMASKTALLIIGIVGLRKLFSGADGGMSHGHHDQGAYYGGGGAQHANQRMTYIIRGRQLGDQDFWNPTVEDEKKADLTEEAKNDTMNFGMEVNESKPEQNGVRKSKSLKAVDQISTSDRTEGIGVEDTASYYYPSEGDVVRNWGAKIEARERSSGQTIPFQGATNHGDNGPVTPQQEIYTHDSAETAIVDNDRHEDFTSSAEEESSETQNALGSRGGPRLVKRHYMTDFDAHRGQDHDRGYSAGRRRLDEVEGEHVDAWVIRRKMNRA
ncbi:uncharacterized protein [Periplaneta americana]|uniref:uncharacterized protein n=1 Tax=Periplaneta americana TaxID=6978 RepID=UPI0037E7F0BF